MKHQNIKPNSSYVAFTVCGVAGFLLLATLISGIAFMAPKGHADTTSSHSSAVSVMVNSACTLKGGSSGTTSGGSAYSATIEPGTTGTISGSKLTTICNDPSGYSLYAIGYGNDAYDTPTNTQMIGGTSGSNISTSTTTGGNSSSWAMKLAQVTSGAPEILNSFGSWHVIPETYTQVARYTGATASSSATGAQVQASYQVYIASAQIAGTYTGKVKYVMIHPNTEIPPTVPSTLDAIAADTSHTHYMQDSIDCTNSTIGTKVTLTDSRDGQTYQVAKAEDGQCWMLENLKLGRTLTEGQALTLTTINSNTNGDYILQYSDIPTDGKFHAYTIDGVPEQNNSNEFICRGGENDWDSCYYNWYTATAGAGTTAKTSGSVDTSICPAGWSLPTQPQFSGLYNKYNSAALMEVDSPTTTKNNSAGKIPGFLLSGYYNAGGADYLGSNGRYWSRTAYNAQYAYYLYMVTSSVNPADYGGHKYRGFAVRCLLSS